MTYQLALLTKRRCRRATGKFFEGGICRRRERLGRFDSAAFCTAFCKRHECRRQETASATGDGRLRSTARHVASSPGTRSRRCHRPACGSTSASTSRLTTPTRPASHPLQLSAQAALMAARASRAQRATRGSGTPPVAASSCAILASDWPADAVVGVVAPSSAV